MDGPIAKRHSGSGNLSAHHIASWSAGCKKPSAAPPCSECHSFTSFSTIRLTFYWSRSRILEKLNSLPAGTLPQGVQPTLGPDATALGQIFWYTLEGRNPKTGEPSGGWNPQELRTIQDFYVKYGLSAAEGVSEVASAGGFVKEYQVDPQS